MRVELLKIVVIEGVNGPDKKVLKVTVGVIFLIIACIICFSGNWIKIVIANVLVASIYLIKCFTHLTHLILT